METPPASGDAERRQPVAEARSDGASPRRMDPSELLSRLWQQNLPLMRERVASLEQAARQALAGDLTEPTRTMASDLAHKLAGSLGMFGFPKGTEIAREIEHLLESSPEPDLTAFLELSLQLRSVLPL